MASKDQVLSATEALLATNPAGMTGEALALQVSKQVGQALPPMQVSALLRQHPQRFHESEGGRWSLRQKDQTLFPAESEIFSASQLDARKVPLRRGCYVIFDLEATGQNTHSPATEIIQIAAQSWIDGQPQESWASFVRPLADVPERIIQLTKITPDELRDAPTIGEALKAFFAYVGDLPLIAHNGASYDGPLIQATRRRIGMELPVNFQVLDTLPLARVLLPTLEAHRVGTLAEYFDCARPDAHRADADIDMLGGIVQGLQRLIREETSGVAVYELLRRASDPWAEVLEPPMRASSAGEIIATFGQRITPLLSERAPTSSSLLDPVAVETAFHQAEELGRSRREAQMEMARFLAKALRDGNYAVVEAGTVTGKSQGYLLPAALYARATGQPLAVSTFARVLQSQLVERELPFIQRLVPDLTYTQLQGRANWERLNAAIFTSATLTVYGQGFDFFLSRIGLESERAAPAEKRVVTCNLPQAFNYHGQALLMLPNNLPAPRDSDLKRNFPVAVAELLQRFIPFFHGQTLGLFTSNARRDFVYQSLVDALAEQGLPLLCQGQGQLQRLIDEFRSDKTSSLLGSRSLWEGVDVSGDSLSYVFLEKLPYPSLGDPIEAARMSAVENTGSNSFYDYLLPKMVIILKQGFGRLIRSVNDRGAVVLLDKRLRSSLYRTEILRSLPDPTVGYEADTDMFRRIAEWMGYDFDQANLPAPTIPDIQRVLNEQALTEPFVAEADFAEGARSRLLAVQGLF